MRHVCGRGYAMSESPAEKIQVGSCPSCGTMVQFVSRDGIRIDEYRPIGDVLKLQADLDAASRFITRFIIHDGEARPYSVRELQLKLEQVEGELARMTTGAAMAL